MAQVVSSPDIEYTAALLTRILSQLVGTLANTTGVPDLTGLSRPLLREWFDGAVPTPEVAPLSLHLVEAAIDIVTMSHPLTQADSIQRYAWRYAADLHAHQRTPRARKAARRAPAQSPRATDTTLTLPG
jgi:hypothetical protein